jgi:hypothetical protein
MAKEKDKDDKAKKIEEIITRSKEPDKPTDVPADKTKEEPIGKMEGVKKEFEQSGIDTEDNLPRKLEKGKEKVNTETEEEVGSKSAKKVGESLTGSNANAESDDENFEETFNLATLTLVENVSGLSLATIVENIGTELKSLKKKERKEVALFCVACAIGNRKLASKYITECVKKVIAKEIFVINATFKFSVFAILGHYLMRIFSNAAISKAFAWIYSDDTWIYSTTHGFILCEGANFMGI